MLFNTYTFLIGFLPLTICGFYLIAAYLPRKWALGWLTACSFFFYGYWNPIYVPLLLGSIIVNYRLGAWLADLEGGSAPLVTRRWALGLGIALNLGLLGWYKYAAFFVSTTNTLTGTGFTIPETILPLAISFFTFQQITFLVDSHRGMVEPVSLMEYALFVAFFPQLIAGPIVHWSEIMPQYSKRRLFRLVPSDLALGLTIFALGAFKKVIIADGIADHADPMFAAAATSGDSIEFFQAWTGILAYTFQLYFDFSGYSDMAIGLGRMFGIRLPMNFDSPYKATSIIDFWHRWHMTLSRFLRNYLYIPLGGNRRGPVRRYVNIMATMVLGGLWHGASWTFVAWGALHGAYLLVNHAWRQFSPVAAGPGARSSTAGRILGQGITFLGVVVAWVFFRADSFDAAFAILRGMAGLNGATLAIQQLVLLGPLGEALSSMGVHAISYPTFRLSAGLWILTCFIVAFFMPNVIEWTEASRSRNFIQARRNAVSLAWQHLNMWHPNTAVGIWVGVLLGLSIAGISSSIRFLYFQF